MFLIHKLDIEAARVYHRPMPYILENLPTRPLDMSSLLAPLGRANRALARYAGNLEFLRNPDLLLSPFLLQDCVLSSRIEGTQTTLDDVLAYEAGSTEGPTADSQEVINYREALRYGAHSLQHRELSFGLLREMHALLLRGVRGESKDPGQVRRTQNWIGARGCSMETAGYVPPAPETLSAYLDNWDAYLRTEDADPLIQVCILHAQFEMIHPFLDGNGRIGRLMIPLFLNQRRILHRPVFYLSEYLEKNRDRYMGCLADIERRDGWEAWILFMLNAIAEQASVNTERAHRLHEYHEQCSADFRRLLNSPYSQALLDAIFAHPIFNRSQIREAVPDISAPTLQRALNSLCQEKIISLHRDSSGRRPALYAMRRLLDIASGREDALDL